MRDSRPLRTELAHSNTGNLQGWSAEGAHDLTTFFFFFFNDCYIRIPLAVYRDQR